jgi:hypothetical protein
MNKHKFLKYGLIFSTFLLMFGLNCLTPMIADDISYSQESYGFFSTFQATIKEYLNWNGRFIGQFLGRYFVSSQPGWIFKILNSIMYVCLILLILRLSSVREKYKFSWLKFILANALVWIFIEDFGQVILWRMGSTNYLWCTVVILFAILPVHDLYVKKRENLSKKWLFPLFFLGLIAGWGNENTSTSVIISLLFYFGAMFIQKRKTSFILLAQLIGALIGYGMLIFSPGAKIRSSHALKTTFFERILKNGNDIIKFLYEKEFILLLIFILLLSFLFIFIKNKNAFVNGVYFFILGLIILLALSMVPVGFFGSRACFGGTIFLIIGVLSCFSDDFQGSSFIKFVNVSLSVSLIAAFVLNFFQGFVDIYETRVLIDKRASWIVEQREQGNIHPMVLSVNCKTKYYSGVRLVDITPDETEWLNGSYAKFYGVERIFSTSEKLFKKIYKNGTPQLMNIQRLDDYLKYVKENKQYTAIISGFGNQKINQSFRKLGLNLPEDINWGYFAYLQDGELKSEWQGLGSFDKGIKIADKAIWVRTEASEYVDVHLSRIILDGYDYSRGIYGLNIVVLNENGSIKDSVAFNVIEGIDSYLAYRNDNKKYISSKVK